MNKNPHVKSSTIGCTLCFVLLLTACSDPQNNKIQIQDAWIREVPVGMTRTAGYFKLTNTTDNPVVFVGGQSKIAQHVALHTTIRQDNLIKMRPVKELAVASGDEVVLEPGGQHLMFMGLTSNLVENTTVQVTLLFQDGQQLVSDFTVRSGRKDP